ncbi:hypothetical protein Hdeb2414_s0747g00942621 [Helianthus debilis subsp. tardiflorus]
MCSADATPILETEKKKQVARETGDKDQPSRAKSKPWTKIEEDALAKAWISTSKKPHCR